MFSQHPPVRSLASWERAWCHVIPPWKPDSSTFVVLEPDIALAVLATLDDRNVSVVG